MSVMEHDEEAKALADKLHNVDKFTIGELTRIAALFHVRARDLLAELGDERGAVITINAPGSLGYVNAALRNRRGVI